MCKRLSTYHRSVGATNTPCFVTACLGPKGHELRTRAQRISAPRVTRSIEYAERHGLTEESFRFPWAASRRTARPPMALAGLPPQLLRRVLPTRATPTPWIVRPYRRGPEPPARQPIRGARRAGHVRKWPRLPRGTTQLGQTRAPAGSSAVQSMRSLRNPKPRRRALPVPPSPLWGAAGSSPPPPPPISAP